MILLVAVLAAVISVPLLGGRLSRLQHIRLRWSGVMAMALVLQVVVISVLPRSLPVDVARALHVASYVMAASFLWVNRRVPWLWLIGLGGMSNFVAIGANGGVMPASRSALAGAGKLSGIRIGATKGFSNSAYQPGAHLRFLGDIFDIPQGWPLSNVFSMGDILIVVGAFLLLHSVTGSVLIRSGGQVGTSSDLVGAAAPQG